MNNDLLYLFDVSSNILIIDNNFKIIKNIKLQISSPIVYSKYINEDLFIIQANSQISKINKNTLNIYTLYQTKLINQFRNDLQTFIIEDINLITYFNEEGDYCFYNYEDKKIVKLYKKVHKKLKIGN